MDGGAIFFCDLFNFLVLVFVVVMVLELFCVGYHGSMDGYTGRVLIGLIPIPIINAHRSGIVEIDGRVFWLC